ncbi:hypothetical protein EJ04DRAFT_416387, partial [Polyplosphaeria fusca]
IAASNNDQFQSPLVRLPAEIKNEIYAYCFAAEAPIVDPITQGTQPGGQVALNMGIALLQTCRSVYWEVDRRPLFARNTFRFTCVDRVRTFLKSLPQEYRSLVHDIEIDARRLKSDSPGIAREWLHYLAWGGGTWARILGSLREDAQGLECLRLNFESWPSIPMFRIELWNLLRSMLVHVRELSRIIVIGASKGAGMAKREPWSPVHFVGADDVGSDDLVQRMWRVVGEERGDDEDKVIRWNRGNGKLYLEVVKRKYLVKEVDQDWAGPSTRKSHTDPWPENGS